LRKSTEGVRREAAKEQIVVVKSVEHGDPPHALGLLRARHK
jgi:hypothetical protein